MRTESVILENKTGLHARPAADFVKKASSFKSDIKLIKDGSEFNGKSILNVLSMGAVKGTKITIKAEGADEDLAVSNLVSLIKSFNE
ncbi:MAG TPA: HPr family phosphocarrier protein [Tepiditoga sp.]|nr:HPr family phosphocarrier protein [Thermotogota bacterium]HOO73795.1 HPr family phosphocarrier protein [Tepiditoga sp.]